MTDPRFSFHSRAFLFRVFVWSGAVGCTGELAISMVTVMGILVFSRSFIIQQHPWVVGLDLGRPWVA